MTLTVLDKILQNIHDTWSNNIVKAGKFNFYFECKLDWNWRKSILKIHNISQIRNIIKTSFQNCISKYIQCKLDHFFMPSKDQVIIKNTNILASFSKENSPIFLTRESLIAG